MESLDTAAVNSLVKFSEVFLWDDVMDVSEVAAYRQNKKKYFHSDDEDDGAVVQKCDKVRKVDSLENGDGIVLEAVELSQQMSEMGLPVSFNSSKKNINGSHRATRKCTRLKFSPSYSCYAEAMEGSFTVSAVNMNDPKTVNIEVEELVDSTSCVTSEETKGLLCEGHVDHLTDDYPLLTACSINNKNKTVSSDFGIDPATVLSYSAESADTIDANKELDEELNHEFVEASSTNVNVGEGEVDQCPNGVEMLLAAPASNPSLDVLEDIEWNDNNCYGEYEDWRMYWDESYQQYYYFNINTTESTWEPPQGMEHLLTDDIAISTEKLGQVSNAKKNRKTRKSRARKNSFGTNEGDVTKYWCQRYYLFSKFDDGIKMDEEGWYSVTPERIAEHHASRCGTGVILDLFTGVGGNAIQFAQRSELVIAVDIDPCKIAYARHNAAIYGVDGWIDFIQGNSFSIAPSLKADTVYLSPPWGGPEYAKSEIYDLKTMLKPYDGYYLFNTVKHIAPHIVMFLPRNVDVGQLVELAVTSTPPWSLEVEKNFLNGKLKAITAYFWATETTDINYTDQECHTS